MQVKPLIVGEQNPYGGDDEFALWPNPGGCAGWRLCYTIFGFKNPDDYLERFDRTNLLRSEWNTRLARAAAFRMLDRPTKNFILLGTKVAKAFGFDSKIELWLGSPMRADPTDERRRFFVIPHPSGRCRAWQNPRTLPLVRELLKEFLSC